MFKKRIYITFFFILILSFCNAQYQAANWPLSYYHLVLKITPGNFERDSLPSLDLGNDGPYGYLANSSISDSLGNLLLYSFGYDVRNKYGNQLSNGCCVCEDASMLDDCTGPPHPQGALFLPKPGNSSQFYLFIKDMDSTLNSAPQRITATTIDLKANNDSGELITQPISILTDLISNTRMTACLHGNGRDWWLINHQYLTNKIYTHLITPDSIYGPFEQNIGLAGIVPEGDGWGIFSPTASLYANTTGGMGAITLLDFDRCSGTFSNFRSINTSAGADSEYYFNLAFSPSGRFLYASNARWLEQYDLQATDIEASRVQLIHDTAGFPLLGQMVLMPDGKIYQVGWTVIDSMLSVIDSPDVKGLACGFHLRSLLVPNSFEITTVPNFPTYNLGPLIGSNCDTLNTSLTTIENYQLKIAPNPADEYVDVNIDRPGNYTMQLLNEVGQIIYNYKLQNHLTINTQALQAGVYLLRTTDMVNTAHIAITKKLMVVH